MPPLTSCTYLTPEAPNDTKFSGESELGPQGRAERVRCNALLGRPVHMRADTAAFEDPVAIRPGQPTDENLDTDAAMPDAATPTGGAQHRGPTRIAPRRSDLAATSMRRRRGAAGWRCP